MNPAPPKKKFTMPPIVNYVLIGLLLAGVGVALIMLMNRGQRVQVDGTILKVRTISVDDNASIAVVDFRMKNPSDVLFQVKQLTVVVTRADGTDEEGATMTEMDLDRVLDFYKATGPRFNPTFKLRDRLKPGEQLDRTAAGSFSIAEKSLLNRRNLVLKIQDADGIVTQIAEHPAK